MHKRSTVRLGVFFLAFLDATIVNVAFPNIRESFPEAGIDELSWILNAYSIVFAAFLVVSGRLAAERITGPDPAYRSRARRW